MKVSLAAIIITKNEAENIKDCIASVSFADEIIVIDSGSTDDTITLAKSMGAIVYEQPMGDDGFAGQRNFGRDATNADWLFYIDADEKLTLEAKDEILAIINNASTLPPYAYEIKRINIIFGQAMKYGGHSPDYCLRLFPRSAVNWVGIVHEQALTNLPVKRLTAGMEHHTYNDWDKYFVKFNQYTTLMARKNYESGKKISFMMIFLRAIFAFLRFYILKLGFLDGKQGLIFATNHAFYTLVKYIKLYYYERGYS